MRYSQFDGVELSWIVGNLLLWLVLDTPYCLIEFEQFFLLSFAHLDKTCLENDIRIAFVI
ncbi:hypothetical protein H8K33_14420 [Undibacterium amnicola]|uniref:Uncharacterized protein n=1 Tax=Undibacterium amnicola TaxID=1834038 RepID=A0ABR6XT85_9BURK|nr:hypothetical protein [Undibacterium amnicola]